MAVVVHENHFASADEVNAELQADGYRSRYVESTPFTGKPHRHNCHVRLYVLDGAMTITDVGTGETQRIGLGSKVIVPQGVVH